jgi:hypothetical protein
MEFIAGPQEPLDSRKCSLPHRKRLFEGASFLKWGLNYQIYRISTSRTEKFTHMGDIQTGGWPLKFTQLLSQSEK